jgi:hypothetical protein
MQKPVIINHIKKFFKNYSILPGFVMYAVNKTFLLAFCQSDFFQTKKISRKSSKNSQNLAP